MKDYKKILEGVVNIINTTEKSDIGFANICTYIGENCPEIKESEDDRIREALINQFSDYKRRGENHGFGYSNDKILVWLEKQGQTRKITHEEICKSYGIPDIGEFSDGYHTFNGLYKQRMVLFAVLVNTYKDRAWKSWKHEDGLDCFGGGWFIVGIDTPAGTYTYHYEAKDWDMFDCKILDKAKHWDGHDESDVERLFSLLEKQGGQKIDDNVEPMSLDEAIEHCKGKSCGNNVCALEHKQLEKWLTELKKLKEQKPWSQEDERILVEMLKIFNIENFKGYNIGEYNEDALKFLKSIKDRVQPKQEWSETVSIKTI